MSRFLSYSYEGVHHYGVVTQDGAGIVELDKRLSGAPELGSLLAQGRTVEAQAFAGEPPDRALDRVTFERLIPWPSKIFCIGVNYGGRSAEYADTSDAAYPSVFVRFPDSFVGHDQPLLRPPESPQLDYEGEIVAVIGTEGRRIPLDQARNHLAGLSLANEGTIRDWVRHAKFNVTQGKNWERSGAIGPWMVTMDEFDSLQNLELTTHVNGELRQSDTPATMKYSIDYQIHYLSSFTTLRPGDLILTGTPTGAGARFDPPIWLNPGDVIDVHVPEIGTLRNIVADEFPAGSHHQAPSPQ